MSPTRADSNVDPSGEKRRTASKGERLEILNLESSVSALQRIQAGSLSYKSAPGQAAAKILSRRLSDKRDQLERSRRSQSVIVQRTSTPNVSSNGEDYLRIAFGVEDAIPPPPPPQLHLAPFPIFQDPLNPPV